MLAIAFIIGLLSPFAALAFFIFALRRYRAAARGQPYLESIAGDLQDSTPPPLPMERADFWAIIGRTTSHKDPDAQVVALRKELDRLSPVEIASFQATFDDLMRESYSWDLWGALYVAHGGASDDAFDYFRAWLISNGQKAFETIVSDPDSLADIVTSGREPLDSEGFAYVAGEAWEAKTGRHSEEIPRLEEDYLQNPLGTPFVEKGDHLAKRYPRLWKRFGTGPAHE